MTKSLTRLAAIGLAAVLAFGAGSASAKDHRQGNGQGGQRNHAMAQPSYDGHGGNGGGQRQGYRDGGGGHMGGQRGGYRDGGGYDRGYKHIYRRGYAKGNWRAHRPYYYGNPRRHYGNAHRPYRKNRGAYYFRYDPYAPSFGIYYNY